MDKSKSVFLFGAGALYDWKGPSTSDLTKLVLESGFSTKHNIKITQHLYDLLIDKGFLKDDLNFETIFNVIEELIVYYSDYDKENRTPSIPRSLFNDDGIDVIFNFSIDGNEHGFKLNIPADKKYNLSGRAYNNENP